MPKGVCDYGKRVTDCVLQTFVGARIGKGAFRRVYTLIHDEKSVLKVEDRGCSFCNVNEWKVWKAVVDTPIEHWFAPCSYIDAWGTCLIQARTVPFDSEESFKQAVEAVGGRLPAFFDDIHFGNFGMLDGRLVCHDYGFTLFLEEAVKMSWSSLVHPGVERAHHDTQLSMDFKAN